MPNAGKIAQIIGPVVDVSFTENAHLPKIYDALEIVKDNGQKISLEVQQQPPCNSQQGGQGHTSQS